MNWSRTRLAALAAAVMSLLTISSGTAQANPLPDPYTQIVNHQVPISPQPSQSKDGPPTYMAMGWGKYYLGPNGLEMRFTSAGTSAVITWILTAESLGVGATVSGSATTMGDVILGGVSPASLRNALSAAHILSGGIISDIAKDTVFKNLCLGVTIPKGSIGSALNRATALMGAQLLTAFKGPYTSDVRVWLERCSGGKTTGNGDVVVPVQFPAIIPAKATPAQPVTGSLYTVYHTGGLALNVRPGPSAGSGPPLYKLGEGARVTIDCQVHGQRVFSETDIWDHVASGGWVYDEYISTLNIGTFSIRQC